MYLTNAMASVGHGTTSQAKEILPIHDKTNEGPFQEKRGSRSLDLLCCLLTFLAYHGIRDGVIYSIRPWLGYDFEGEGLVYLVISIFTAPLHMCYVQDLITTRCMPRRRRIALLQDRRNWHLMYVPTILSASANIVFMTAVIPNAAHLLDYWSRSLPPRYAMEILRSAVMASACVFMIVLPTNIALVRAEAALIPADVQTHVPISRFEVPDSEDVIISPTIHLTYLSLLTTDLRTLWKVTQLSTGLLLFSILALGHEFIVARMQGGP